eukprot:scaffold952_cov409-Prasinococcus_capsulatus_cf.AAC.58
MRVRSPLVAVSSPLGEGTEPPSPRCTDCRRAVRQAAEESATLVRAAAVSAPALTCMPPRPRGNVRGPARRARPLTGSKARGRTRQQKQHHHHHHHDDDHDDDDDDGAAAAAECQTR